MSHIQIACEIICGSVLIFLTFVISSANFDLFDIVGISNTHPCIRDTQVISNTRMSFSAMLH